MRNILYFKRIVLGAIWALISSAESMPLIHTPAQIEREITEQESRLKELPLPQVAPMRWTYGYRHILNKPDRRPLTIELTFDAPQPVDLIAITPTIFTKDGAKLETIGFPRHFKLEGLYDQQAVSLIADYQTELYPKPAIQPQLFQCDPAQKITGLRLTCTELPRGTMRPTDPQTLSLSEISAFAGNYNVALGSPVRSSHPHTGGLWEVENLTDGFTLYIPADGQSFRATDHAFIHLENELELQVDFDQPTEVNEIRLWPILYGIHQFFPQKDAMGFPLKIRLSAPGRPDLLTREIDQPGSSPLLLRFPAIKTRRLTLHLEDGFTIVGKDKIAFSELEFFNRAERLAPRFSLIGQPTPADIANLSDGYASSGAIIPQRQHLEQVAQRKEIEFQLLQLRKELDIAQRRSMERFGFAAFVSIASCALLVMLMFILRLLHQRRWSRLSEQLACDLHDELGANMSSVAHSAELLKLTIDSPSDEQQELVQETIETARETAQKTRSMIQLLGSKAAAGNLAFQINETARKLLGPAELKSEIPDPQIFKRLSAEQRWDLFLFTKEALNNIQKHAQATRVRIQTSTRGRQLKLSITDNGIGLNQPDRPLHHLEQRAKKMKACLTIETAQQQGTTITLNLRMKKQ